MTCKVFFDVATQQFSVVLYSENILFNHSIVLYSDRDLLSHSFAPITYKGHYLGRLKWDRQYSYIVLICEYKWLPTLLAVIISTHHKKISQ